MERQYPIYTVDAECQDCYKCLRQCPVKAIRVEEGHARVAPEACVACGGCVAVCPARAKHIRNDLNRAKHLLTLQAPVYASLAPSWVSEFPDVNAAQMIAALRHLGFAGVGETALGAQEVSSAVAAALSQHTPGIHISSACPAVVSFVCKYLPEHAAAITHLHSPLLAHCRLLRQVYGDNIRTVFVGPCIAKKAEADTHPELLDVALTFEELQQWFTQQEIVPAAMQPDEADVFVPEAAEEGALYPVEGGMIETVNALGDFSHARFVSVAGIEAIGKTLKGLNTHHLDTPVFIEALACEGGCVGGPCTSVENALLGKRLQVEQRVAMPQHPLQRQPRVTIEEQYQAMPVAVADHDPAQLRDALMRVGKKKPEDELNCSGCGYNSCREFAAAMLENKAEPTMCVSYMRKLAHNKANALLRCMPSGVVIVNAEMRIIECNERFAQMFGEEVAMIYEACPGLNNCSLAKVLPFTDIFKNVLASNEEIHYDHYRYGDRLLNITVFSLEPHQVVGAVILDVTRQELQRDQIAQRAQEVIRRNLSTVQEIACMLGEHVADTEILLRSIAEGYTADDGRMPPRPPEKEKPHET